MIMQPETCFITRSLAARGVASVCADVQPPWTGTWCLFFIVQKPFANREEIFVFLPGSASREASVPQKHKWVFFISLYLPLQIATLRRCQPLPVPFESSTRPSSASRRRLQLRTGQDCSLGERRQRRVCFPRRGRGPASKGQKRRVTNTCISHSLASAPLPAELCSSGGEMLKARSRYVGGPQAIQPGQGLSRCLN